ncbi:MAG: hypothetical protein QOH30_1489 [Baekduia sp.]|jgi:uncharacterized protein with FMN-binding domain|nr:hypothetical protein [Baekduia sp.]
MKRAPIVLSATVAGLAVTLGFHAHAPAAPPPTTTAQASAPSSSGSSGSSGSGAAPAAAASSSTKTVTSDVASNQYGNVQLKVTVSNGKVTKIEALQVPQNDRKSAEINAYAEPALQASALQAQSANIDTVSGATYTSDSYKTALQSALDKAGLSTAGAGAS